MRPSVAQDAARVVAERQGFALAMLTQGKSFNARPNARPLGQVFDDQRELIKAGYPVLRQPSIGSIIRGPGRMRRGRGTGLSRAFWIGVLIGLLVVGLVFAMA
jgi:hypothetical protein